MREKLIEILDRYFYIGDSYAYNLTKDKVAFTIGTMSLEDFEEFDEETITDLADYLIENGVVIADEVVSKELCEQIKWERDVAIKQLERIGVSLGEKTDNIVSVVRCGECAYAKKLLVFENFYSCLTHETFVSENDYCSYGEPKENGNINKTERRDGKLMPLLQA